MLNKTPPSFIETQSDPTQADVVDGVYRRTMLRLALAGGALSFAPFAMAQGGTPKRGGTLTIGADADPIGLDPVTVTAFSSFDFTALLYTGLLRWNAEMKIEPCLSGCHRHTLDVLGRTSPA